MGPLKKLEKKPRFHKAFIQFGANLLRKIVGEDEKLTSKSKVDLARLAPCHSALKPHLQRILENPKPFDDGQRWIRTEDGVLEPVWSYDAALPNSLVDLLDTGDRK